MKPTLESTRISPQMLQQIILHYPDGGHPPKEATFHLHQNEHHLHDHHQGRKRVPESALAHQKDIHPHGSPWNKRQQISPLSNFITNPCQFHRNREKTAHSKKSIAIFTVPYY
jgi:hypothetical protein